ncbi:hypothetical protein K8R30_04150 [archaeon]|nr:hypothetical protein [archaeon]
MKKENSKKFEPTKLAFAATAITSATALFATTLALISPDILTITPFLQTLYGPLGYSLSLSGSLLGALYVGIDTFILTWLFAKLYNRLL